jgi:hypothetical protein
MPFDAHKNLAVSLVAIAPVPAASGVTLDVSPGTGARFPAAPFNAAIWPAGCAPRRVERGDRARHRDRR